MNSKTTRHVCVLGHGITYSRSPLIHNYWMSKYGVDAEYGICDLPAAELPGFIASIRDGSSLGCNVTIPYKQAVIPYLDVVDDAAKTTGSVNTIYRSNGLVRGTSTDGTGYVDHLKNSHPDFPLNGARVLVLGAGGAARSIADALVKSDCSVIYIANRTVEKAEQIAGLQPDIIKPLAWNEIASKAALVDLIINTTSLGMTGRQPLLFPVEQTGGDCIVSDIVYAPLETELLARARGLGRPVLDGLGMLLHQAVPGFHLWFGIRPQVTGDLRALVEQDLLSHA